MQTTSTTTISRAVTITAELRAKPSSAAPATQAIATPPSDKVSLAGSTPNDTSTYADPRTVLREIRPDLATLLDDSEKAVTSFMAQLRSAIEGQGLSWAKVFSGEQKLSASPTDIAAAKQAISDDGEWGVRKTAERILTFALGTTGGDPAKLDKVRAAVQSGFDAAREQLGGKLPQISEDTYKAVMGEMDRWQQEGLPTGDAVTLAKAPAKA